MVWGSKGNMSLSRNIRLSVLRGVFAVPLLQKVKAHQTQKLVECMRELCRIVEVGGCILAPICGSRTTLIATKQLGYDNSVGIESCEDINVTAKNRVDAVNMQTLLANSASFVGGFGEVIV